MVRRLAAAFCLLTALVLIVSGAPLGVSAQAPSGVSLSVEAGYDGYFRSGHWTPLRVTASNNGADILGTLRVTASDAINQPTDAYAITLDLPRQSSKQFFVYIPLSGQTQQVRLELLTAERVVAMLTRDVRPVRANDVLFAVITESPRGGVDLRNFRNGLGDTFQANWRVENVPRIGEALRGLDALILTDADTGNLSLEQRRAIEDWVLAGGHLIVTGGPNWQKTQVGVTSLLPMQPSGTLTLTSLPSVAAFAGVADSLTTFDGSPIIVASGVLLPDAEVLIAESGTPILVRRKLGGGMVDYLALDPSLEPFQSWANRGQFWFTLLTTATMRPSWANGVVNTEQAIVAADFIKGLRLPDVLQLGLFLLAYVVVIGPLNYLILRQLKRREWAWFTIPLIVVVTSVLYYVTGFSLRGTQAIINRMAVVQVWQGSERAQVDGVVGVLAPRRSVYSLAAAEGMTLRTLTTEAFGNIGLPRNLTIYEDGAYVARDFPIEAGTTQAFALSGYVDVKPIEGEAILQLTGGGIVPNIDGQAANVRIQVSLTNTSGLTLNDAVLLAAGGARPLGTVRAGQSLSVQLDVNPRQSPPSSLRSGNLMNSYTARSSRFSPVRVGTVFDIMGTNYGYGQTFYSGRGFENTDLRREMWRRQTFLEAMIADAEPSGGRGTDVYLVGWSDESPLDVRLDGAAFTTEDTTLYIFRLPTRVQALSSNGVVELPSAYLTWTTTEASPRRDATPYELFMQPAETVIFRYLPMPLVRLREVQEIRLFVKPGNSYSVGRGQIALWDWQAAEWVPIDVSNVTARIVDRAARFIGPENAVEMRVSVPNDSATVHWERIDLTLYGRLQNAMP
ncbi:MAG: hypothetical protein D6749_02650 [Chloroflexota bacterium]|nr:MAG: hypothetical protein D6749_02650 [Chloroflexota bacterium]